MIWLYTENIGKERINSDVNNTARLSAVILTHWTLKKKRYIYAIIPGPVFGQEQKGGGIPVKAVHTEEVPIHTNQSIAQRNEDSVYRRGTYIYINQSITQRR